MKGSVLLGALAAMMGPENFPRIRARGPKARTLVPEHLIKATKDRADAKQRRKALARAGEEINRASKALIPILQERKGRGPHAPAVDSREEMVAELKAYGVSDYALRLLDQVFDAVDAKAAREHEGDQDG